MMEELFRFGNDTDLIRMVVSLRKQLHFQRSRPAEEMVLKKQGAVQAGTINCANAK